MSASKPDAAGLSELLKRRRTSLGYSRTRLAELSGVRASTIEAWETGRVGKPPIHDVLKLARALSISATEIEAAAMRDDAARADERPSASPPRARAMPLLERAMVLLEWSESDAASALETSLTRVQALRRGEDDLTTLEVMSLIALLAAFPSKAGGADEGEVADLLTRLRRVPT